ncbi:MAG TPA: FkbM family methyltransferase [Rhizomicrobium sp.]|nr:FkbM family methyltransferase [Rhizomicrobium sp.]
MTDFTQQSPTGLMFHGYHMMVPSRHPIIEWNTPGKPGEQPYRESGLVLISRALKLAGKKGVIIDIGANIGDSMIIIASNSGLPVHCLEASDFFFAYLKENINRHFPGQATLEQAFVTSKDDESPMGLLHWGGTAKPISAPFTEHCGTLSIRQLLSKFDKVGLLKVDTDGYDQEIILGAFETSPGQVPENKRFPIYFEFEIASSEPDLVRKMCQRAIAFFRRMSELGYEIGFFWDDLGRCLGEFDIGQTNCVRNIINYMTHLRQRPVWGFDICLIHREDPALTRHMRSLVSQGVMVPYT